MKKHGAPVMRGAERRWLYGMAALLGGSGFCWWLLELFGSRPGPFGPIPHPLVAPMRLLHGVLAVPALFLIGWVAGRHARPQWKRNHRRLSGGGFAITLCALVVSGFALFFVDNDVAQHAVVLLHEWLGVAILALGIEHWSRARRELQDRDLKAPTVRRPSPPPRGSRSSAGP